MLHVSKERHYRGSCPVNGPLAGRDVEGNVRPDAKGAMSSDGGLSVLAKTESSQYRVSC